ncbi:TPA: DUF559 domain-containing protein [Pseudomonas aeruginosa]|nr:DUF559 domain-containing protein [Klebsiella pneumoniae subsp. pneumoniae]
MDRQFSLSASNKVPRKTKNCEGFYFERRTVYGHYIIDFIEKNCSMLLEITGIVGQ